MTQCLIQVQYQILSKSPAKRGTRHGYKIFDLPESKFFKAIENLRFRKKCGWWQRKQGSCLLPTLNNGFYKFKMRNGPCSADGICHRYTNIVTEVFKSPVDFR